MALDFQSKQALVAEVNSVAATAQSALAALRQNAKGDVELLETLNDIESMAFLGRYYADKTRGAAKLARTLFQNGVKTR